MFYELGRGQLYTERQVRLIYKKSTLTLRDTVIKWTALGPDYEYPLRHVSLGWTGVYSKTAYQTPYRRTYDNTLCYNTAYQQRRESTLTSGDTVKPA